MTSLKRVRVKMPELMRWGINDGYPKICHRKTNYVKKHEIITSSCILCETF
jgi:hypothetical protein